MEMNEHDFGDGKARRIPITHVDSGFELEVVISKEQITKEKMPCSSCGTRQYEHIVYGKTEKPYCSDSCRDVAEAESMKD